MSERPRTKRRIGHYTLDALIGDGPTGAVYYTEDANGSPRALKLMHPELSRREPAARLLAELDKLGRLGCSHFPPLYDAGFDEAGQLYLVTEAIDGRDLSTLLEQEGPLSRARALRLLDQLCDGLERAHAAGLVHGSLKPRNVFINDKDWLWLLDFGAARHAGDSNPGLVIGDPLYMAPEQLRGQADRAADVYALGLIACQCLDGALPFGERAQAEVTILKLGGRPLPLSGLDEELAAIIQRALMPAPEDRPGVNELRRAIARWAEKRPAPLFRFPGPISAEPLRAETVGALTSDPLRSARPTARASAPLPPESQSSGGSGGEPPLMGTGDSIAASLERFLREAQASFPATEGWLLGDEELELREEDLDELESEDPHALRGRSDELPRETALLARPSPTPARRLAPLDRVSWKWVGTALLASFVIGAVLVFVMAEALLPAVATSPPAARRTLRLPVVTPLSALSVRPVALPAIELAGDVRLSRRNEARPPGSQAAAAKDLPKPNAKAKVKASDWIDPFDPLP